MPHMDVILLVPEVKTESRSSTSGYASPQVELAESSEEFFSVPLPPPPPSQLLAAQHAWFAAHPKFGPLPEHPDAPLYPAPQLPLRHWLGHELVPSTA